MANTRLFIGLGIAIWLVGVVLIRLLGPYVFDAGWLHILFFGANFIFGAITVWAFAAIAGLSRHRMLVPTTVVAMVAMLLDGVAVTLDTAGVTHIYADTAEHAAYAGGLLLFAFWSAFFFALLWHREAEEQL